MIAVHTKFALRLERTRRNLDFKRWLEEERPSLARSPEFVGRDLPAPADFREDSYSGTIIDAYSALEGFLRDAASSYVRAAQRVVAGYDQLPEVMKRQHLELSLAVLGQRSQRRWAHRVDVPTMLRNLTRCVDGLSPFSVNDIVFEDHRDVFRHAALESFLARLGVSIPADFQRELAARLVTGTPLSGVVRDVAGGIDLLADRRNEISHGVTAVELLSYEILSAIVDLVEGVGLMVLRAMLDSLASFVLDDLSPLGEAVHVFRKPVPGLGVVLGIRAIHPLGQEIRVGGWLVAQSPSQPLHVRVCHTNSIEVRREARSTWLTDANDAPEAGIGVDRFIREGWLLCCMPDRMRRSLGLG